MSQLVQSILAAAQALPEGGLLSPKEFLHLASRAAVDQALTRMTREGRLLRVGRGVCTLPRCRVGLGRVPRPHKLWWRRLRQSVVSWWCPAALLKRMPWG